MIDPLSSDSLCHLLNSLAVATLNADQSIMMFL